ncbi:hypothetical protein MMC21_008427 [Puttea exsequens]|nr:hypothetical protein [Puttea exsequens]
MSLARPQPQTSLCGYPCVTDEHEGEYYDSVGWVNDTWISAIAWFGNINEPYANNIWISDKAHRADTDPGPWKQNVTLIDDGYWLPADLNKTHTLTGGNPDSKFPLTDIVPYPLKFFYSPIRLFNATLAAEGIVYSMQAEYVQFIFDKPGGAVTWTIPNTEFAPTSTKKVTPNCQFQWRDHEQMGYAGGLQQFRCIMPLP